MLSAQEGTQKQEEGEKEPAVPRFSINHMDLAADPSKDFYRYCAGKWIDANPVPKDKARWASFSELYERNLGLLRGILEESASSAETSPPGSPKRLIGDFYKSAMDTKRIEELRFQPILPYLRLVENLQLEDLGHVLALLDRKGVSLLFHSYSAADKKNSSVYAFYLIQGGLSLPDREYYLSPTFENLRKDYRTHLTRMFKLASEAGDDNLQAEKMADVVLRIETELAKASRTRTELRDQEKNYNRMTREDLQNRVPSLQLSTFFGEIKVPETDFVIIGQPEFFDFVQQKLLSEDSLDDLKIYLRWRVLHSFAPFLHSDVENEDFDFFHKKLLGQQEQQARWKRATALIDGMLGEALGKVYVEKYFPPEAKRRVSLMIDDLREVFRDRLARLPWMTEATRKQALAKFERFGVKIGYPEHFRDYSSIKIDPEHYIGNISRASEFETLRQTQRVGQTVDKSEWLMTPPTVNAYFQPMENTINFPAGILQPPFFDVSMDDAVNYGSIGAVIGHEITHGYDDQGRKFDADGNLRDWWTEEDAKGFQERAKAVVELYNMQEVLPGARINGELTLGENIADFGGVSLAFEALERRLSKEPEKRKNIDGFTPEQRFFIAYGQIWRANVREEEIRRLLTIDPHSPGRFRAFLPATNHPEFDRAFPSSRNETGGESLERTKKLVAVW